MMRVSHPLQHVYVSHCAHDAPTMRPAVYVFVWVGGKPSSGCVFRAVYCYATQNMFGFILFENKNHSSSRIHTRCIFICVTSLSVLVCSNSACVC